MNQKGLSKISKCRSDLIPKKPKKYFVSLPTIKV